MSRTARIHQIVHVLETSRNPVPIRRFLDELEISRATFKRDMEYLRDRLGAPIEWRRGKADRPSGYLLGADPMSGTQGYGVRGLWFNQSEIYALLTMHRLAGSMQPGLISNESQSLLTRITHLLGTADDEPEAILSFIRILPSATRRRTSTGFETIARATVRQRRLLITYYTRSRDEVGQRLVSPQRLLHYRENWYLLAWCHKAKGLRLFALDAVRHAELDKRSARKVGAKRLEDAMGSSFGIFGGAATHWARLRFAADAARWVSQETWHPRQRTDWQDGSLIMELPYAHSRELVMEILRHGRDVEVLGPAGLRAEIEAILEDTLALYRARPQHSRPVNEPLGNRARTGK
jgi:predicted DNA-binding transcriptional regulator YafY